MSADEKPDLSPASRPQTPSPDGLNEVGAAEAEVGRYIYRRIDALMDAKPGTPDAAELVYLSEIAERVEEYGEDACAGHSLASFLAPHPADAGHAFTGSALVSALGEAPAGQSDVLSCLYWAFENYGRLAPPKEGYSAYDDPEGATARAILSHADVAAGFFGYELPTPGASAPSGAQRSELSRSAPDDPLIPPPHPAKEGK